MKMSKIASTDALSMDFRVRLESSGWLRSLMRLYLTVWLGKKSMLFNLSS